ncbi:hypothetical protein ABW19_dt0207933 [Dactylella cylindrospora]|nr:hypothetical protein ABW19_dt0207933 [Dactylella cylindrospora]
MLAVPRAVPPFVTLPSSSTRNPHLPPIDPDDDDDDLNDFPSQRPSLSDDRFYLPVCSPVVTTQPAPLPDLSPLPGKFPSSKDVSEAEAKPTRRTSPLVVVQTGVFYFFSCGWCGPTDLSKRVRKDAEVANQSLGLRERWRYEIENRPKALRKLIKTTADNVETNIVPSIMARMSHHYHYYTGTEPTVSKSMDVKSMSSEDTYAPLTYSRWRGKGIMRPREGSRAAPPIQNFAESTSATYVMNNDLMWMMEPPPAAVWKSDGRQGPRLALAEEDEMIKQNIEPRIVTTLTSPVRPRPTIMRIPTLPSIESLNSRVIEEQERERERERDKDLPQLPPAVLQPMSASHINRRIPRLQPLILGHYYRHAHSKSNSLDTPASPIYEPYSAPARSMSWETATATTTRSSSDRDFTSRGSDGTSSPTTIYSTIPRLKSPSLTKSALATKDENGNPELSSTGGSDLNFLPRTLSIKVRSEENLKSILAQALEREEELVKPTIPEATTPISATSPGSPRSRIAARRRSIPLSGLRV